MITIMNYLYILLSEFKLLMNIELENIIMW